MNADSPIRIVMSDEAAPGAGGGEPADVLLRRSAKDDPDRILFVDPPNRAAFGLGEPARISAAEADRLTDRIARAFAGLDLAPGAIVALQVPNIREAPLLMLGAWRAGLVPVPLPMMWRLSELQHALTQLTVSVLCTVGGFAGHSYTAMACQAAADHVSVRHVLGIGADGHGGVTPIDHWFAAEAEDATGDGSEPFPAPSMHDAAVMTWASCGAGPYPVPRTHAELHALARLCVTRLPLGDRPVLLNCYPLTTITALGGFLLPALAHSATLVLHQPFDYQAFVEQIRDEKVTFTAIPEPVAAALKERGDLEGAASGLAAIGCICPAPHLPRSPDALADFPLPVFDIYNLNEWALIVQEAGDSAAATDLPLGKIEAGDGEGGGETLLETRVRGVIANGSGPRQLEGTLLVRGSTVPSGPLGPAGALSRSLLQRDAQGFLDTRIQCSIAESAAARIRCERDAGLIYHGGVAVAVDELDRVYADFPDILDAAAFPLQDGLMGERIFAAVVPRHDTAPTLDDFKQFLAQKGVAPYKAPDQLIIVNAIPRSLDGTVLRDKILDNI